MTTELDRLAATPFHDADPATRARMLSRLADTELFVLLTAEPVGDQAELRLYDLPGGSVAMASDDAGDLATFLGAPVPYVALPGRALAAMLAAEGQALLVNPGRASEMLLDAAALAWLEQALTMAPDTQDAAARLGAPHAEAVAALAEPLTQRLADMTGRISGAALVAADWPDGRQGHLLAVAGAAEADRPALAKAFAELLAFLPELRGGVDVTFAELALPAGALTMIPEAVAPARPAPKPDAPPRLRW